MRLSPRGRIRIGTLTLLLVTMALVACSNGFLYDFAASDVVSSGARSALTDYQFDQSLDDSLGASPALVSNNTATSPSYVTGRQGTSRASLQLSSQSSSVYVATLSVKQSSFTIGVWFSFLTSSESSGITISCIWPPSAATVGAINGPTTSFPAGAQVDLIITPPYSGSSPISVSVAPNRYMTSGGVNLDGSAIAAGSWHHATVTYDRLGRARLYVDGALEETIGVNTTLVPSSILLAISGGPFDNSLPSTTTSSPAYALQDLRVFKGALDRRQVKALYQGTLTLP